MLIFHSNAGNSSTDEQCSILNADGCNRIFKNSDKKKCIYYNESVLLNSSFMLSIHPDYAIVGDYGDICGNVYI